MNCWKIFWAITFVGCCIIVPTFGVFILTAYFIVGALYILPKMIFERLSNKNKIEITYKEWR